LVLDRDPDNLRELKRTPSPKVAKRIVYALPLSEEQRQSLLEHMVLASERRLRAYNAIRSELPDRPIDDFLSELRQAHQQASFAHDFSLSRAKYRVVREGSGAVLKQLNLDRHPLAFVELCFLRHDAQCVLNRPDDALWYAKLARSVLETLDPSEYRRHREKIDDLVVNAIRAEAVAYHNLKLFREAYRCCEEAEASPAIKRHLDFWKPHLYRDKINALVGIPRFAITEAEGLAEQVQTVCEKDIYREEENNLLLFLIRESLARSYIQHGNFRKAERILQSELERMDRLSYLGPLHRTLLLRTYARLCWKQGDHYGWQHLIHLALVISFEAGLDHQVSEIQTEYGDVLAPILQDLLADHEVERKP
jgi:tetratricopeptide (TPR) repeat protein